MNSLQEHKRQIEKQIVDKALSEYGEGKITREQLKQIADYTVDAMSKIQNHAHVISFLNALSTHWTFFQGLAMVEEGEQRDLEETEVHSGVLTLAQNGKIDDAIKLAKSMTE
jgi:hypothetical protein